MITLENLKAITNQKDPILYPFVIPLNDTLKDFSINTSIRQIYFLAQICHESGCFRYTEELASGDAYDTRVDLGNTLQVDGDGKRYKGRGLIQLTGTTNYKELSKYFGIDFVANPMLLKNSVWACKSAGWFWNKKLLNVVSDKNDFLSVTFAINGGFNGLEDRLKYLVKSFKVLKISGLDVQLNKINNDISSNLIKPNNTRFSKLLTKAIPDKNALSEVMKKLQSL